MILPSRVEIWRDAGEQFTTIRELTDEGGDLSRGITSGANKFFFVPRPEEDNKYYSAEYDGNSGELSLTHKSSKQTVRIEPEYWMRPIEEVPQKYHDQFDHQYVTENGIKLVPDLVLVKNREIETSPIEPQHLSSVWVRISDDKATLKSESKSALSYVELGEDKIWGTDSDKRLSNRRTFNSRTPWYNQPTVSDPYILLTRYVNAKYQFHFNPCAFPVADNFYYLSTSDRFDPAYLAGFLNSTIGWFMAEISSRTWTNALKFDKTEFMELPVLDAEEDTQTAVGEAVEELMERNLKDVFTELGGYNPDEITLSTVDEDRMSLDAPIFDELGLNDKQQEQLYKEMVQLVRDRLMRQPDENPSLCETIAEHNPQYDYSR